MKRLIIILSILFLFLAMYFSRHYLSIFFFQNDRYRAAVNIEVKNNKEENIFICFNKNCDNMKYKNGIYSYKLNQENQLFYSDTTGEIEIISDSSDFADNIKNVTVFSKNLKYLTDFNAEKVEFKGKTSYSVSLGNLDNNKSLVKKIAVYFESIFYNWYFYLISYILIIFYFVKYKPEFKIKTNLAICLIVLAGLFLRLSHINYIPLWNDELYSICYMSDGKLNLLKTFTDAGNPPLFFIISNIWLLFFNKNIVLIRLLPCLVGLAGIYLIYFILKKLTNNKTALTAAFLCSINIFVILESTEIRSYILSMLLIPWCVFCFYELHKEFLNKNLFFYLLSTVLLINTHYYALLFCVFNFILGIFVFRKNIKFIILNSCAFLTLAPYLYKVINISLSNDFNTWIEKPTFDVLSNHITFYFGNIIFLILTLLFTAVVVKYCKKNEIKIILYNISAIVFVFLSAYLFSLFFKPILFERYFCIFLPLLIVNTSIFLNADYKTKFSPVILCIILIASINMPKYENFNIFSNINDMMRYLIADSKNKSNYYFVMPDRIDYVKYFKEVNPKRAVVSIYGVREDIDLADTYNKNIKHTGNKVLYIPEIAMNLRMLNSKELNIKKIETTRMPVYKIYMD